MCGCICADPVAITKLLVDLHKKINNNNNKNCQSFITFPAKSQLYYRFIISTSDALVCDRRKTVQVLIKSIKDAAHTEGKHVQRAASLNPPPDKKNGGWE